ATTTTITLSPIGTVRSSRADLGDDDWDRVTARIGLAASRSESLAGLEDFSHAEIVFYFGRVDEARIERRSRHPRGNVASPKVGIFAQRGSARPKPFGLHRSHPQMRGIDAGGRRIGRRRWHTGSGRQGGDA